MAGRKPGTPKTGGRKKGTPNKRTLEVAQRLEELGSDPIVGMTEFAKGSITCFHCDEKGLVSVDQYFTIMKIKMLDELQQRTPEQRSEPEIKCPYCRGTKKRALDDSLILKARSELMQYIAPKRKAVDINHSHDKTWEDFLEELNADDKDDEQQGAN